MGMRLFGNSLSRVVSDCRHPNDPNPNVFEIQIIEEVNKNVVALINYPNCKNFEGDKVVVWKDTSAKEIKRRVKIDPHFLESDPKLIARFRPTPEGWSLALKFAEGL